MPWRWLRIQSLTQPPHLRPGISVLGHEDGSTPLLTVAGVIMHVLTTSTIHVLLLLLLLLLE